MWSRQPSRSLQYKWYLIFIFDLKIVICGQLWFRVNDHIGIGVYDHILPTAGVPRSWFLVNDHICVLLGYMTMYGEHDIIRPYKDLTGNRSSEQLQEQGGAVVPKISRRRKIFLLHFMTENYIILYIKCRGLKKISIHKLPR